MSDSDLPFHPDRLRSLNDEEPRPKEGRYVLYWMQQSQRAEHNHALELAIRKANEFGQSCLVCFGLMDDYPQANERHYRFMLEGLKEVKSKLAERGIKLVAKRGAPDEVALQLAAKASLVVTDRGYLRHQKKWRRSVARKAGCRVLQVEGDVVVPVETASDKREFAARTIRKKIMEHYVEFLDLPRGEGPEKSSLPLKVTGLDLDDPAALCRKLNLDRSVPAVSDLFRGGPSRARRHYRRFLEKNLSRYVENRSQPHTDDVTYLSMYLHFGQISPVFLAADARKRRPSKNIDAFLEELLVRRELAANFVHFSPRHYDSFKALPDWARETLLEHKDDEREHLYTRKELEKAETHDHYWNAAMLELKHTGYMHNHMRMYWGKQILRWTNTPEYAYRTALFLNNKYFLDGRDCNSFANVGWLFGLHDRPWQENPVFGKVRTMTASGLERKTDPGAYVEKVRGLVEGE